MSLRHFICAGALGALGTLSLAAASAAAPQQQTPETFQTFQPGATSSFMIFLRGTPVGVEQIAVSRTTEGWSILSTGRLGPPFDVVARKVETRYNADWHPLGFTVDTLVRGEFQRVITTVQGTAATSAITAGTNSSEKTDTINHASILLPH